MGLPKQLVNIIGSLVVLAIIAAGVALIALPVYLQSTATAADAAMVAQGNDIYQLQVDDLREAEGEIDTITADVDSLRMQIPEANQLDDVFELVAKAATATKVTVASVSTEAAQPFVVRTSAADSGEPEVLAPPAEESTDGTTTDGTTTDGTATDGATTDGTGPDGTVTADPAQPTDQVQVPFTITIDAPSREAATAFLDALRAGPRLLGIVQTDLTPTGESTFTLTVNALTFVQNDS